MLAFSLLSLAISKYNFPTLSGNEDEDQELLKSKRNNLIFSFSSSSSSLLSSSLPAWSLKFTSTKRRRPRRQSKLRIHKWTSPSLLPTQESCKCKGGVQYMNALLCRNSGVLLFTIHIKWNTQIHNSERQSKTFLL